MVRCLSIAGRDAGGWLVHRLPFPRMLSGEVGAHIDFDTLHEAPIGLCKQHAAVAAVSMS